MAQVLLSYCIERTSNHFEAEDLAQDIILEIYKSAGNIRNEDAIYGFMWVVAADMVRKGYIISSDNGLFVNAPVFTKEQYKRLMDIFADTAVRIADEAEALMGAVTKIRKNHVPVHLKKLAGDMSYLRLLYQSRTQDRRLFWRKRCVSVLLSSVK